MSKKLRVLIADDHNRWRSSMTKLLYTNVDLIGAVTNGNELIDAAISLHPDVVVSDISMPVLAGNEALKRLKSSGFQIPFVLVSADTSSAWEYISQGAMGFVAKTDLARELVIAVVSVHCGQVYVSRKALMTSTNLPRLAAPASADLRSSSRS